MQMAEEAAKKLKEAYGPPREGYEDFLKQCKFLKPLMPETSDDSMCIGYELPSGLRLHDIMLQPYYDFRTLQAKPTDVLVVSYPKTGTTWTAEICYLIMNNGDLDKANSKTTQERIPFLEFPLMKISDVEHLPEPRLIKTHLPYEDLPKSFLENKTKIVYVTRNPKDAIVSNFHFVTMLAYFSYTGSLGSYIDEFLAGRVMYSHFADNVLSFWKRRHQDNICFLKYEDLKKDFSTEVRKIATFLGKTLTDEQFSQIASHCSFNSMSKNIMTNQTSAATVITVPGIKYGFMRKGTVGDWKNHFTEEQSQKVDVYAEKHFKGAGLEFDYEI